MRGSIGNERSGQLAFSRSRIGDEPVAFRIREEFQIRCCSLSKSVFFNTIVLARFFHQNAVFDINRPDDSRREKQLAPHFADSNLVSSTMSASFSKTTPRPDIPTNYSTIKTATKSDDAFRCYDETASEPRVVEHYRDMRRYQTVDFYRRMERKYSFENGQCRRLMTIDEAFEELEHYVVSIE